MTIDLPTPHVSMLLISDQIGFFRLIDVNCNRNRKRGQFNDEEKRNLLVWISVVGGVEVELASSYMRIKITQIENLILIASHPCPAVANNQGLYL